ncbi:MAG: elongation factor G [Candidatus Omnitrophica bacterium]|nr:elongation factor G [Candidatus Omnitrophota bacterium]
MGDIFNVGFFGHNKSGKTVLGESILFKAKAIERMGDINAGTTTFDYDEEAVRRQMSVNLSLGFCQWQNKTIYLVDCPGYMDFVGEQLGAVEAVDVAIINVAANSGVEVGTERIWEVIQKKKVPAIVFVNKLDLPEINLNNLWAEMEKCFGVRLVFVTYPVLQENQLKGVSRVLESEPTGEEYRQKSMDSLAEIDDTLMEKYLETGQLSREEISSLMKQGLRERRIMPVLCGSAINLIGIEELLDFIVSFLPSSEEMPEFAARTPEGEAVTRKPSRDEPLSGMIVKTISDPFVGRLSYLRVRSGKLQANSTLFNVTRGVKERVGNLLRLQGKKQEPVPEAYPGEVVAVAKLMESRTFDTFCDPGAPIVYAAPAIPEAAVSYSIAPKVKGTEDKLGNAIGRITEEDPTIKVFRDPETGETIISGMGDVHLDVTINKFKNRYGVEVEKGIPKIAYKETITTSAQGEGKHKKQTGGRGQYGHCFVKVEPLPRGAGYEFVDEIVGGAIPRNFIPSVEKGVREGLLRGVLARYPIVDIRVRLYDGSYHVVDSSDIAFQLAGILAVQKAVQEAKPILLEPIVNVEVRVPQEFVGDIIGSINAKRGRVLDMSASGNTQIVKAQVPLAEMSGYTSEIRSITSGKGSYLMAFSHYEEVPAHLAERIIDQRRREREEKAAS